MLPLCQIILDTGEVVENLLPSYRTGHELGRCGEISPGAGTNRQFKPGPLFQTAETSLCDRGDGRAEGCALMGSVGS
jgi:hypothetical protein